MFKIPKRCEYCAHKLDADGHCVNPNCIAYVATATTDEKAESGKESDGK